MKTILIYITFIIGCNSVPLTDKEGEIAVNYLKKYGYLPENYATMEEIEKKEVMYIAVLDFQNMAGMTMTGDLDKESMDIMDMPRCGMRDMRENFNNRMKRYDIFGKRWEPKEITYFIKKYSQKMKDSEVSTAIQKALDIWSNYVNIKFVKATNPDTANINIGFYTNNHGDSSSFDGPGHVLAHAYYPTSGEIHFDDSENWTPKSVYDVGAHEIGHALGLRHSNIREAIMTARYSGEYDYSKKLHADDIDGIQEIYNHYSSIPNQISLCSINKVQTIISRNMSFIILADDKVHLFKDEKYYSSTINSYWSELPANAKGFLFKDHLIFFSGDKYWKYKGRTLLADYPKSISIGFRGIPNNIDAAMLWKNKLYFFKGGSYWVYDRFITPKVISTYPKVISNGFDGFPNNIDAIFAIFLGNVEQIIAVKDKKVYRYDSLSRTTTTETIENLFRC